MTFRLKKLTVDNFRSIRGRKTVELDAPIVLVHGPNGAGKTSLLSAIELGLTGAVAALSRHDDEFLQHLHHKDSPNGVGSIDLTVMRTQGEARAAIQLTRAGIHGAGLLSAPETAFFSERCYLAQSTLGRLLEIYQHQDARRSDSPLTRFVRELLGLDPLDALIDGLTATGHVNRFRSTAPQFWAARTDLPGLQRDAATADAQLQTRESELEMVENEVRSLMGDLLPAARPIVPDSLGTEIASRLDGDDRKLVDLMRRRRDLQAVRQQIQAYSVTSGEVARQGVEQALKDAQVWVAAWTSNAGQQLERVVQAVQAVVSNVPPVANGAAAAQTIALVAVTSELERLLKIITREALIGFRGGEASIGKRGW